MRLCLSIEGADLIAHFKNIATSGAIIITIYQINVERIRVVKWTVIVTLTVSFRSK